MGWLLLATAAVRGQPVALDEELPAYVRVPGVSGSLTSTGSDTMNILMALWKHGFNEHYPNVRFEVEGKGSSTAPTSLIAGSANIGAMSRPMKREELEAFERAHGYAPVALATSVDVVAVYVHRDNPLKSLTLAQVDAMFSATRRAGHGPVRTWGDLGLTGAWTRQPISLYGRNSASGTYGYVKEHVLLGGDFQRGVKEQPGSAAVVQGVATDRHGVGYCGIGYRTADVRAVGLAEGPGAEAVEPLPETAYAGAYPLARFLRLYVNRAPNTELDPVRREFLRYVFSRDGQRDVIQAGYYPITAAFAARALAEVGIEARPTR